jgi:hypothetical protein
MGLNLIFFIFLLHGVPDDGLVSEDLAEASYVIASEA